MDLKLQQALVAARSGHLEAAQVLLAELIQEKPGEANAWFMLSYLVDTSERQARYLQQTLTLDPHHNLAQTHLTRLLVPGVPAPVIRNKQKAAASTNGSRSVEAAVPPAVPASPPLATVPVQEELPEWLQDLDNKQLGSTSRPSNAAPEWREIAGTPKREQPSSPSMSTLPAASPVRGLPAPVVESQVGSSQKMLLGILLALVLLSMLVLAFLVLQIFF